MNDVSMCSNADMCKTKCWRKKLVPSEYQSYADFAYNCPAFEITAAARKKLEQEARESLRKGLYTEEERIL